MIFSAFAERSGCEVVGVFRETGSGARKDRAERRRVIALTQGREIDMIFLAELMPCRPSCSAATLLIAPSRHRGGVRLRPYLRLRHLEGKRRQHRDFRRLCSQMPILQHHISRQTLLMPHADDVYSSFCLYFHMLMSRLGCVTNLTKDHEVFV